MIENNTKPRQPAEFYPADREQDQVLSSYKKLVAKIKNGDNLSLSKAERLFVLKEIIKLEDSELVQLFSSQDNLFCNFIRCTKEGHFTDCKRKMILRLYNDYYRRSSGLFIKILSLEEDNISQIINYLDALVSSPTERVSLLDILDYIFD